MEGISIEIKTEGMDELKKLLNKAVEQVEQLESTLTQIKELKIQVSSQPNFEKQ
ncbi:hypothetical protein LMG8526HA_02019 [Lactococcus lactis]|uniref:hypothetical protein n=1 Tax=Lactococcus lactis TaxID=1358 RepID=UPI00072B7E83|nr:hypothetical protein [Lactococcus lactis]KSU10845.1 hypothetical protein LMG8526_1918 [Lactococcus lactis subsp. lactis]MDU0401133.1 hypothetical protein [Lactococcus lactis]